VGPEVAGVEPKVMPELDGVVGGRPKTNGVVVSLPSVGAAFGGAARLLAGEGADAIELNKPMFGAVGAVDVAELKKLPT
jgi:hypothetical protein